MTTAAAPSSVSAATRVDTRKVALRRVELKSLDELWAELDLIEGWHRAGTLRHAGNWEAGPIFRHLALPIEGALDGFTMKPVPLVIGALAHFILLPILLRVPIKAGVKPGKAAESVFWKADTSFEQGIGELRACIGRLRRGERMTKPHPFFGRMNHAHWLRYNLRHCDLHLGFLHSAERC